MTIQLTLEKWERAYDAAPPRMALRTRVRELLQAEVTEPHFRKRWGHAALLHAPATEILERAWMRMGYESTCAPSSACTGAQKALLMLRAFRDLELSFVSGPTGDGVIGRSAEALVPLADASVSTRHAALHWSAQGVWVMDLRSLNGTQLNGQSVTEPTKLEDGDLLTLGDANLVFVTSSTLFLQLESVRHSHQGVI